MADFAKTLTEAVKSIPFPKGSPGKSLLSYIGSAISPSPAASPRPQLAPLAESQPVQQQQTPVKPPQDIALAQSLTPKPQATVSAVQPQTPAPASTLFTIDDDGTKFILHFLTHFCRGTANPRRRRSVL